MARIYDFKALASNGKEVDFSQFEGRVLLIVNTASRCGFTPQFDGLDPGSDNEIEQFCQVNYGVTFQIMKKTDVNGPDEHPVFTWLKAQAPTEEYHGIKAKATHTLLKGLSSTAKKESDILWNFTKFLVHRDGTTVERFAPTTEPAQLETAIEAALQEAGA